MLLSSLPLLRLVLVLALLTPLAGFAQSTEDAPPTAPAAGEEAPAPPLVPAPEDAAGPSPQGQVFPREQQLEEERGATFLVPRLVLQPPAGFVLGGALGYASIYPLLLLSFPICKGSFSEGPSGRACELGLSAGIGVSAALGAAMAVTAVGRLLHGRGRFWHTALGALLGIGAASTIALTTDLRDAVFIATVLTGSALGATAGFAISESYFPVEPKQAAPRAGAGASVMPVVSTTRKGGILGGLVGRF